MADAKLTIETLFEPILKLSDKTTGEVNKVASQLKLAVQKAVIRAGYVDLNLNADSFEATLLQKKVNDFANSYKNAMKEVELANKQAATTIEARLARQQRIVEAQKIQVSSLNGLLKLVAKDIPAQLPGTENLFTGVTKGLVNLRNESRKVLANVSVDLKKLNAEKILPGLEKSLQSLYSYNKAWDNLSTDKGKKQVAEQIRLLGQLKTAYTDAGQIGKASEINDRITQLNQLAKVAEKISKYKGISTKGLIGSQLSETEAKRVKDQITGIDKLLSESSAFIPASSMKSLQEVRDNLAKVNKEYADTQVAAGKATKATDTLAAARERLAATSANKLLGQTELNQYIAAIKQARAAAVSLLGQTTDPAQKRSLNELISGYNQLENAETALRTKQAKDEAARQKSLAKEEALRNRLIEAESKAAALRSTKDYGTVVSSNDLAKLETYQAELRKSLAALEALNAERKVQGKSTISTSYQATEREIEQHRKLLAMLGTEIQVNKNRATEAAIASGKIVSANQKEINALERLLSTFAGKDYAGAISSATSVQALQEVRRELTEQKRAYDDIYRRQGKYGQQGKLTAQQVTSGIQQTNAHLNAVNERVTRLTGGWNGLNNTIKQFFRYALFYGGMYQLLGVFSRLTGSVVTLQAALKSIQAVTQATDREMQTISASIKQVALSTKFSAQEIANAALTLGQAGVAPANMQAVLQSTANFASAVGSTIETAADLITTFRDVYKNLDTVAISDKLTTAVNISKLTAEDLKTIVSISAQTSKDIGLSADQYLAAVSSMRNAGIKASTISTGLRQLLIDIFSANTSSLKILEKRYAELGERLSQEQIRAKFFGYTQEANPLLAALEELQRIGVGGSASGQTGRLYEVRAMNALRALINDMEGLRKNEAELNFGGAAAQAAAKQMEALSNKFVRLGSATTFFAEELTRGPVEALGNLIDNITEALKYLTDLDLKLKSYGGKGLASDLGVGAAVGTIVGSVTGGGALKKVITGTAAGAGTISSRIGGYSEGTSTAETLGNAALLVSLIAALKSTKLATTLSGITKGGLVSSFSGLSAVGGVLANVVKAFSGFGFKLGLTSLSVASIVGLRTLFTGIVSFFGGPWVAGALALGYVAVSASKAMPNLTARAGEALDYAAEKITDFFSYAADKLSWVGDAVGEALTDLDATFAKPATIEDQKEALKRLEESERAYNERIKTRLDAASERFEKYKEYSPDSTSGVGDAISRLRASVTYQQTKLTEFIRELGSTAAPEELTKLVEKYAGITAIREKGSQANIDFMKEVADATGATVEQISENNEKLMKLVNAESQNRQSLAALKKQLQKRIADTRGKSEAQLIEENLQALVTAIDTAKEGSVKAIESASANNYREVIGAAEQIAPAAYEAAKKELEDITDRIKSGTDKEGPSQKEQLEKSIAKIIAIYQLKGEVPAERELKDLVTTQDQYFKNLEKTWKVLNEALKAALAKLPNGTEIAAKLTTATADISLSKTAEQIGGDLQSIVAQYPKLAKYTALIKEKAEKYGVDAQLMTAMVAAESAGNPFAKSSAGALGLGQIMPDTATRFGSDSSKMFFANDNLEVMAKYLKELTEMFGGNKELVAAAYNAGENAVKKYGNTVPPYKETQGYVKTVSKLYGSGESAPASSLTKAVTSVNNERVEKLNIEKAETDAILGQASKADLKGILGDTALGAEAYKTLTAAVDGQKVPIEKLQAAWETYTTALEERKAAILRQTKEENALWAEQVTVTKAALEDRLAQIEKEGGSSAEYALVRNQLTKLAVKELDNKLAELESAARIPEDGASSAEEITRLESEKAKLYLSEMQAIRDYTDKYKQAGAQHLSTMQELTVDSIRQKLASATAAEDYDKANVLLKELQDARIKQIELKRQEILTDQNRNSRTEALAALDQEEVAVISDILALMKERRAAVEERLQEQKATGAKTPEETKQIAAEQGANILIPAETQAARLQSRIAAYDISINRLNSDLQVQKELLAQTNLTEQQRAEILDQIKTTQKSITEEQKAQSTLTGELSEKAVGLGQVWSTFSKAAQSQVDNLEETIGGQLVSGVSDLVDSLADAVVEGKNLKETFTTFFASFLKQIATAILKVLLLKAITSSFGASSTIGKAASLVLGAATANSGGVVGKTVGYNRGGVLRAASGGVVDGAPGIDTNLATIINPSGRASPAFLTKNEAILPAKMVKALGVSNVQKAIDVFNRFGKVGFSQGGIVSGSAAAAAGKTTVNATASPAMVKIVNVPGNSVVNDFLKSTEGESVILNVLERNPTRARRALGG